MTEIPAKNIRYYNEQYWYARNVLRDFLEIPDEKLTICEVGTAEGGALKYFSECGHHCFGIEYSESRHQLSQNLNKDYDITLIEGDITRPDTYSQYIHEKMDIVICRDVIEHIDNDQKLTALQNMIDMLKPGGTIFISFPPKYSPYAGHQQSIPATLAKLPFIFMLPDWLYSHYLALLRVPPARVNAFLNVKHTRLSIHRFESLLKAANLSVIKRKFYIVRPAHENRYKIKRISQPINDLFFREWLSTGALYCLKKQ